MSYSAMSHQSAGYVVTASNYNQFTDNDAACAVAAFTTKGDLFAATGSTAGARLAAGANFFAPIYHSGESAGLFTKAVPLSLFCDASEVSVSNTVTETALFEITLPANWLTTKNWINIKLWVYYNNNTGSDRTLTYKLYYGSNTFSYVHTVTSGGTTYDLFWDWLLRANGSASAQMAAAYGIYSPSSGGSGAIGVPNGTLATDATASQTLKMTMTLSTASTSLYLKTRTQNVLFNGTTQ